MYEYPCKVRRVVDGDTLDLDIDLGLGIHAYERVRLSGLDAPEINTEAGKLSKAYVEQWVSVVSAGGITVETIKDREDKYGRYLAVLWDASLAFAPSLNADLLKRDYAKPYDGGKR